MKLRVLLVLSLVLAAGTSAWAASIGLFSTPDCSSCNLTIPVGDTGVMHVRGVPTPYLDALVGAELRIVGVPAGWIAVAVPNPVGSVVLGDVLGAGANIAFSTRQPGACISFWTVYLTATSIVSDAVVRVTRHTTPSNPNYLCPLLIFDYGVLYFKVCAGGGELFLNSTQTCSVGVEPATWTGVKQLYRD